MQSLNNKILSIVEARRKAARNRRNGKSFKGKDLLSYLFEEDENGVPILSTEELVVNTKLFILAGHDTTATTLVFALYELSRKPHVILKLRNEIDPLFKKRENPPKYSQLRSCDYLEAVIRETQRLHAAVIYSRSSGNSEVVLKTSKYSYVIPKETEVMISPCLTHRLETEDDPLTFVPDRVVKKTDPYFPFAMDARNCVGRELAMTELRAVIAHIIFDYDFDAPAEEVVAYSRVTLSPNRCNMKFRRRIAND